MRGGEFKAYVFRWHYKMHVLILLFLCLYDMHVLTAMMNEHVQQSISQFISAAFSVLLLVSRVVAHRWDDHQRAQLAASTAYICIFIVYVLTIMQEIHLIDAATCSSPAVDAIIGVVSEADAKAPVNWTRALRLVALDSITAALGVLHWSMGLSRGARYSLAAGYLATTPTLYLKAPNCETLYMLGLWADAGFLFGCLIGHVLASSLHGVFTSAYAHESEGAALHQATTRLEQLQKEKERLGFELQLSEQRNRQLSRQTGSPSRTRTRSGAPSDSWRSEGSGSFDDELAGLARGLSAQPPSASATVRSRQGARGELRKGSAATSRMDDEASSVSSGQSVQLSESLRRRLDQSLRP